MNPVKFSHPGSHQGWRNIVSRQTCARGDCPSLFQPHSCPGPGAWLGLCKLHVPCMNIAYIPPTKTSVKVGVLTCLVSNSSIFSDCWWSAANSLYSRIAGGQMPKPRCLSPTANSLYSRIAGGQVPKPRCLSPNANSLYSRIAGCQVPKTRCLSPKNTPTFVSALRAKGCLDFNTKVAQQ